MFALSTMIREFKVIKHNVFVYIIYNLLKVIIFGYKIRVMIYVKQWYMFKSAKEMHSIFSSLNFE